MQSRIMSVVEAATNVLIGLVVSLISQLAIFKLYDIHITLSQNVEITMYFTVISIVRSYALRRLFNRTGHE